MGNIWYEVVNGEGRQVAVCQQRDDAECLAKRYSGGGVREGMFTVFAPLPGWMAGGASMMVAPLPPLSFTINSAAGG